VPARAPLGSNRPRHNRRILEEGTLYVARWEPEGRRRFAAAGDVTPVTPTSGTGRWVEVREAELRDTAPLLRARLGEQEWLTHFATNRPEDVEAARDGRVFIALTNNSVVKDSHGSIRVMRENDNDPEACTFAWRDYAAGGPSGRGEPGEEGFSSPVFMVPTRGSNRGTAFRFAKHACARRGHGTLVHARRAHSLLRCAAPRGGDTPPSIVAVWKPERKRRRR